jgi:hypothetical protein
MEPAETRALFFVAKLIRRLLAVSGMRRSAMPLRRLER